MHFFTEREKYNFNSHNNVRAPLLARSGPALDRVQEGPCLAGSPRKVPAFLLVPAGRTSPFGHPDCIYSVGDQTLKLGAEGREAVRSRETSRFVEIRSLLPWLCRKALGEKSAHTPQAAVQTYQIDAARSSSWRCRVHARGGAL